MAWLDAPTPNKNSYVSFLIISALFGLLTACGSNSETSNTSTTPGGVITEIGSASVGLTLPRAINIGAVKTDGNGISTMAVTDADTDYSTDPVEQYLGMDANISMDFANVVLCLLDEVDAVAKVNQGPYQSSFNNSPCNKNTDSTVETAITLTVISYRETDNSPHIIQLWSEDHSFGRPSIVVGEIVTTKGVSEQAPYGEFEFNFIQYSNAVDSSGSSGDWVLTDKSVIRSKMGSNGLPRLEFRMTSEINDMLDFSGLFEIVSMTKITSADFESGQSRVSISESFSGMDAQFNYSDIMQNVFDQDYILETSSQNSLTPEPSIDGNAPVNSTESVTNTCKSRTEVINDVWAYNLYYNEDTVVDGIVKTAGQRVETPTTALIFNYTHTVSNDLNGITPDPNTAATMLYYFGPGQLWGIPFDSDNGYRNIYNLKNQTVLTNASGSYVVKAVELQLESALVDISQCSNLDLTSINIDLNSVASIPPLNIDRLDWPEVVQ